MPTYRAPVADWQFLLHDFLRIGELSHLPGFNDLSPDFTAEILHTAARFHEEVLLPLNQPGDAEGAHFENGEVRTPAGFRDAWRAYRKAGWHRLSLAESLGGGGLPPVMALPVSEMRTSTGHSFSMYNSFCAPSASMLATLGEPWIREHVVPRLSDGDWTATMCMTEPHTGTDLRQLHSRALPQADGTWRLSGRKIFISGGDHDLTDNIVHIVLAKVPDDDGRLPNSLSAVNVFMVSKLIIDPKTGQLGGTNGVHARSIEHKMGIAGSATCVMEFENSVAWRIADTGRKGTSANMAAMFLLMNYARVGTAMSGVAYAEIARQNAADYARERLSGRASGTPRCPDKPADPIIVHPDIRRLLLEARSFAEGARAGAMRAAIWQSMAEHAPDAATREQATDMLEVLTPLMKAFYTDKGFESAVACQQVLGGHGYIQDYGIEHFVRNSRIGQLYEGANGIQAIDLLHRKLAAHGGRAGKVFMNSISAFIAQHTSSSAMLEFTAPLTTAQSRIEQSLAWCQGQISNAPDAAGSAAYDLLTAFGILYVGWTWAEIAAVVLKPESCHIADEHMRLRKFQLARVWMQRQMPLVHSLCARIESGNDSLMTLPDDMI